jgi:hypothetical protein
MLSKMVLKIYAFWWNALFVLIGMVLIGVLYGYLSHLVTYRANEISLFEDVAIEKEFQKFGATKITRSGKVIVQSFELSTEAELKQQEAQSNMLIIIVLIITLPFLLALVYTLYTKASLLAVDRNWCLGVISILTIIGIFCWELRLFMEDGLSSGILFSALPTAQLSLLLSFLVAIKPKEKLSPYYRSRTELLEEEIIVAA